MARREKNRKQTVNELVEIVARDILELEDGDETSIARLVATWYKSKGYEFKHIDIYHGYVWTKDDGKTFSIEENDLLEVLDLVRKKLEGQCVLDFSRYENMVVGVIYNLHFTVRKFS